MATVYTITSGTSMMTSSIGNNNEAYAHGHDHHDHHDQYDYDNSDYNEDEGYDDSCPSEYECDISLRSLHSYSSYDTTLSDLEVCPKDKKFRRMTTLEQDFQMIERLLVRKKDGAEKAEDVSDNVSVSSSDSIPTKSSAPVVAPWLAMQKKETVSMTSIIHDESTMKRTPPSSTRHPNPHARDMSYHHNDNHPNRRPNDKGDRQNGKNNANGRRQQYQGRYNNADGSKTSHQKQKENPMQVESEDRNKYTSHRPSPPPVRKSLLLSKGDVNVNISSARSDTVSVRSDPNASDNSRICKFGTKCVHKSRCGRAHSYNEWEPRMCRFATSCKSLANCRYIHAKESKEKYLRRMVDTADTFYHKNREMYIKSFRLV